MNVQISTCIRWVAIVAATATLIAGCGKKDDPIAQAEKKDVAKGVAGPSIAEVKAIAEEGFIYGLPLVMNYAVMNEFAIDKKSSQFKAPFNEINNQHRVATSKIRLRDAIRDTPLLGPLARFRAGRGALVPAVPTSAITLQFLHGKRTTSLLAAADRMIREALVVGPTGKGRHPPASRTCFKATRQSFRIFRTQLFIRKTCEL